MQRVLGTVVRVMINGVVLLFFGLVIETVLFATDSGYRFQYEVSYNLSLSAWLRGNQGWVFPLLLLFLAVMLGWLGVGMFQLARLLRHLQVSEPTLDDAPPPDHPYTAVLRGRRATYLGRQTGQLPGGQASTRYNFRTESGTTLVMLSEVEGVPDIAASFSTVFARRPLETILYAPGTQPPYDDVNSRWSRTLVLCGDDFEHAYLRHMEEVAALYVDDGEPLRLPEEHAAALRWLRDKNRKANRYEIFVIMGRSLRGAVTYLLLIAVMVYAWRASFLLDNPIRDNGNWLINEADVPRLIRDVRVYLWSLALYFIVNVHPMAYYPQFRWASTVPLLVGMAVLLFSMEWGLDGQAMLFGLSLLAASVIAMGAAAWRTFERRRAWRAARLKPSEAANESGQSSGRRRGRRYRRT